MRVRYGLKGIALHTWEPQPPQGQEWKLVARQGSTGPADDAIPALQLWGSSEDDDAIGIVFRYQDGDNYYRFSMDRERGYRRLVLSHVRFDR